MWVLSIELASCHVPGAKNFLVASRFLETLWNRAVPCLLEADAGPSSEPNHCNLPPSCFSDIHFNIIPSMPRSPKWFYPSSLNLAVPKMFT